MDYYQYIWCSVLNRSVEEFWKLTPRKMFIQIDKHIQFNKPSDDKKGNKKVEYHQGGSEYM